MMTYFLQRIRWMLPLFAALAAVAAVAQLTGPMVRDEGLRRISRHVHIIPDNSVPAVPNVGLIVGAKAILVIDTGLGSKNGTIVADAARKLAPNRTLYLVATHAHPEHDLGAQAFPVGSRLIRSEDQQRDAANDMKVADLFRSRSPAMAELLEGAHFRPADILFRSSYDLDLGGGVRARILAMGPNHTDGDTIVWVPADRVLFSGDLAMKPQPVVTTEKASIAHWMLSFARMEALRPAMIVPSHGPIGDVGLIREYRRYLSEVAERTARAKQAGMTLETATAAVTQAMVDRYPDRGRLATAVKMAFAS